MIAVLILLGTIGFFIYKKKTKKPVDTKIRRLMLAVEILGVVCFALDYSESKDFSALLRNAPGEGSYEESLRVESNQGTEEITVEVKERNPTKEEAEAFFREAAEEIQRSYLGENESAEEILYDLNLQEEYLDGKVETAWTSEPYGRIAADGVLNQQDMEEDVVVNLLCTMWVGDYEQTESFPVRMVLPEVDTPRGILFYIRRILQQAEEGGDEEEIVLPGEVEGISLTWSKPVDSRGLFLAALGPLLYVLFLLKDKEDAAKEQKTRRRQLEEDYVDIVRKLALFTGAGVGIREAFRKILEGQKMPLTAGYFEISVMLRQMDAGVGEVRAYENLGRRGFGGDFRRLSLLLTSNLKKGDAYFRAELQKEEQEAFERRKNIARTRGEEASAKLVFPMMGILGIVIVILIYPAMVSTGL